MKVIFGLGLMKNHNTYQFDRIKSELLMSVENFIIFFEQNKTKTTTVRGDPTDSVFLSYSSKNSILK